MHELQVNAPNTADRVSELDVKARVNEYLEGKAELVPNLDVKCKHIYYISGAGSVFNGNYYIRELTIKLDNEGLSMSADMAKVEQVNYFKTSDVYNNRPDRAPAPPPPPARPAQNDDYEPVNRNGVVTANGGLHARQGKPFGLKVNSSGYVVSDDTCAPSVGLMRKGTKLKVIGKKHGWYYTDYKGGAWSYAKYIRLL